MKNSERFAKALNWENVDRLMTYDFLDNEHLLVEYGGYDKSKKYTFEQMVEINAITFKKIGLDVTRYVYDPVNHWMGTKIANWIRFFGVNPDSWEVKQTGGTAWISKRPFKTLAELEKHMPSLPKKEEIEEWYKPFILHVKEVFDAHDLVFIGAVEGPISDAFTYMDMELFANAVYQAPELAAHVLDCTGRFSGYISEVFAENASAPLMFMGEDICCSHGPIFGPQVVNEYGLPRWSWIIDPIRAKDYKFLFHTDGCYGDFLPTIFEELGADGLNPIERNGCNDIFDIRRRWPDKLLFGNVCCVATLPNGNLADVEDETLELIEKIGPQGGIFIGSSSEVHDRVPNQNTVKMYSTVHEYGSYPIDVERIQRRRHELKNDLELRAKVK